MADPEIHGGTAASSQDTRHRKTPTVMQMEAVECGPASLAMVLGYYGKFVGLEELRLKCGVTRDGSKASSVLKTARGYGMIAKGFKKEPADLRGLPLPAIVFWNFNHFLVIESFRGGKAYLNDPGCGPRVVSEEEFDQSFTGVVLTFEPGPDFKPGGAKPSVITALKKRFAGLESALAFLVLVGVAAVIPGMVIPIFSSVFIDKFLVSGMDSWLKPLLIGMALTAALRVALAWLESYYLLRVQTKIALASASKFFWHVLRLPVEFYTQRSPGEISSRVAINDRVAALLSGDLAQAALSLIQAVFFVVLMFYYDVPLTMVSIIVVGINLIFMRMIARRMSDVSQRLAIDGGKVLGTSMNGLIIMETIKSSGGESGFFAKWAGYQANYVNTEQQLARVGMVVGVVPSFLTVLANVLVLGIGGTRVMDGHLSIGMLVAFQSLVMSFTGPVSVLVGLGTKMQEVKGDMNRLDDVVQYPADPVIAQAPFRGPGTTPATPKLEGYVDLRNITFGYNRADPPLVENFDLAVKPGERVAIVGPSGCGKSTVSRLVMGLYQPWSGELLLDGRPRTAYGRYELANSLALVDQDIVLFEGTIRDNLTMWDESVSEADMIQAAKDACIHDVILTRAGGYDGRIDEGGANLSGGQRQRLEIARALATNPRILVLDEATSALDAKTEKQIDDNLRRRGCACIIIAHRLSTIRDAGETIVLSRGRVVERGTHDDLIGNPDGFYARLIAQQ